LNEVLISFNLAPGKVGQAPYVSTSSPEGLEHLVTITAKTVTGRRDRLRISVAPGGRYLVSGTIGANARVRRYAGTARNARAVLEATWQSALQTAGIEWIQTPALTSASSTFGQLTMAEIVSAPLDSIAAEVNSRSLNIGAESLLRWAGGTMEEGARKLTEHVRMVTGEDIGVHLVDGSGLSTDDRASAYTFLKYLVRFPSTSQGHNFPLLLPANGDGTLRKLSGAALGQGVVRAKTGTLSNVSSLVGYLGHRDGMLVVSVLYNGRRVHAAKQQQWALFKTLGAQGTPVFQDVLGEQVLGGEDRTVPPR
ncbi:MAG: D-alanyl-D-alanine carboxypeptidase, partial [Gemmatimonadota bacterium]